MTDEQSRRKDFHEALQMLNEAMGGKRVVKPRVASQERCLESDDERERPRAKEP